MSEANNDQKPTEVPTAEVAKDTPKKKDNTLKVVLIVVGVIVGLIVLFWVIVVIVIGSLFHRATKNVQINGQNGSVTVKSDNGQSTASYGSNVSLPKNFPSDLPIYKPSTLVGATASDNKNYSATAKTNDSVDTVLNYYRTNMANQGWTSDNESSFTDGTLLSFKKDNRAATISVTNQKTEPTEKTWISISSSTLN